MRRRISLSLVFLGLSLSSILGGDLRYFPQVGSGMNGDAAFETTLQIFNTGSTAEVRLSCFDDQGIPFAVEWRESEIDCANGATVVLQRGEVLRLVTTRGGSLRTGYAIFEAPERVTATAVFSGLRSETGEVLFEAGVPAVSPQRELTIYLDSLGARDSGIALVAAGGGSDRSSLELSLRDASGDLLGTTEVELRGGQKVARFVHEFFSDAALSTQAREMEGSLSVTSRSRPVAAVTLRMSALDQEPLLTAFPVSPFGVTEQGAERILVFAPHPDDEALGCAGVLRKAALEGSATRVVLATLGDAFLSAKTRLEEAYPDVAVDRDGDGDFDMLDYGIIRFGESQRVMAQLGHQKADLIALGYPDAGLDDLWRNPEVYESFASGVSEVPASYSFAYRVGAPYERQSVLRDLKEIIRAFGPTTIYAPTVTDHHPDHWALSKFVSQALLELGSDRTWTRRYGYLIHWEANQEEWPGDGASWSPLSGHAPPDIFFSLPEVGYSAPKKARIIDLYFSQILSGAEYLRGFAKQEEIFWLEGLGTER